MISPIYWINEAPLGEKQIGTMARPRGNDWLEDEVKGLKMRGVDYLVSLLEKSEEWDLGLQGEEALCTQSGIQFIRFPIADVTTPKNEREFIQLVEQLAQQVLAGKRIVIHCRMGIGRSSLLAASTMIKLGMDETKVFDIIRQYRRMEVPDTQEQRDWVLSLADQLK